MSMLIVSMPGMQGSVRSLLADYGVPLMVLVWTGASYALQDATPEGIPRRLALPDPWEAAGRDNFQVSLKRSDSLSRAQCD
jgi:hypothetical protein